MKLIKVLKILSLLATIYYLTMLDRGQAPMQFVDWLRYLAGFHTLLYILELFRKEK